MKKEKHIEARSNRELTHLWAHGAAEKITVRGSENRAEGPWLIAEDSEGGRVVAFRADRGGKPDGFLFETDSGMRRHAQQLMHMARAATSGSKKVVVTEGFLDDLHYWKGHPDYGVKHVVADHSSYIYRVAEEGGQRKRWIMAAFRAAGIPWWKTRKEAEKKGKAELRNMQRKNRKSLRQLERDAERNRKALQDIASSLVAIYSEAPANPRKAAKKAFRFAVRNYIAEHARKTGILNSAAALSAGSVSVHYGNRIVKVAHLAFRNADSALLKYRSAATVIEAAKKAGLLDGIDSETMQKAIRFSRGCSRKNKSAPKAVLAFRAALGLETAKQMLKWDQHNGGWTAPGAAFLKYLRISAGTRLGEMISAAREAHGKSKTMNRFSEEVRRARIGGKIEAEYSRISGRIGSAKSDLSIYAWAISAALSDSDLLEKTIRSLESAVDSLRSGEVRKRLNPGMGYVKTDLYAIAWAAVTGRRDPIADRRSYSYSGHQLAAKILYAAIGGFLWLIDYRFPEGDRVRELAHEAAPVIRALERESEIERIKTDEYRKIGFEISREEKRMKEARELAAFKREFPDWEAWAVAYARGDEVAVKFKHSRLVNRLPGHHPGAYSARIAGKEIETSGGAYAPADSAHAIARAVVAAKRTGKAVTTPKVGYYGGGKAYPDGSLRIGCHLIPACVVSEIAGQLGISLESRGEGVAA